jgi:hypothetical protein
MFLADGRGEVLVFADTDMAFTGDHVARLLLVTREAGVVGCSYVGVASSNGEPYQEAARLDANGHLSPIDLLPAEAGLVEVDAIGAGLMAIRRDVLENVREVRQPNPGLMEVLRVGYGEPLPWFVMTVRCGRAVAEDYEFCLPAREAGHRVVVAAGVRVPHMKTVGLLPDTTNGASQIDRVTLTYRQKRALATGARECRVQPVTHPGETQTRRKTLRPSGRRYEMKGQS